jgi:hypothetical protein
MNCVPRSIHKRKETHPKTVQIHKISTVIHVYTDLDKQFEEWVFREKKAKERLQENELRMDLEV